LTADGQSFRPGSGIVRAWRMAREELLKIVDLSEFVASQRAFACDDNQDLLKPVELSLLQLAHPIRPCSFGPFRTPADRLVMTGCWQSA